jgi:hypothetical protein
MGKENDVASFCTKCGAAVTPDKQFCTACGAPTGAVAAYAPSVAPPPPQGFGPATGYPSGTPGAAGSGSNAVKVILIVLAIFVGLGILGASIFAFTVWRFSRAIHVDGNGGKVTLHTPGGSIVANQGTTYSASDLGTDIYPGATTGHGSMKMDLPSGSMVTGVFVTPDSKDQVVNFYKSKFGSGASVIDTQNGAILTLSKGDHESVMVTVSANSSQYEGKTQIAIVHSKNKG